ILAVCGSNRTATKTERHDCRCHQKRWQRSNWSGESAAGVASPASVPSRPARSATIVLRLSRASDKRPVLSLHEFARSAVAEILQRFRGKPPRGSQVASAPPLHRCVAASSNTAGTNRSKRKWRSTQPPPRTPPPPQPPVPPSIPRFPLRTASALPPHTFPRSLALRATHKFSDKTPSAPRLESCERFWVPPTSPRPQMGSPPPSFRFAPHSTHVPDPSATLPVPAR